MTKAEKKLLKEFNDLKKRHLIPLIAEFEGVWDYLGPAGPTTAHQDHNTKVLGEELKKLSIPFEEDYEYAQHLWDGKELTLKLTHPTKSGVICYAAYDRWGYVVEGIGIGDDFLDQVGLKMTIKGIKKWYKS